MRSWLNGYGAEMNRDGKDYSDNNFLDNAFSTGEQSAIKITNVVDDDADYGTEGGNGTTDKVYLLSIDEVTNPEYGFISSVSGTNTRQAVSIAHTAADLWWLRSPGLRSDYASYVFRDGSVSTEGFMFPTVPLAARPALHLNLSSVSSWSYAGTVTAVGKVSDLKLKQKKGTVTASWKKTTGAKGYQICYSASKKWKNKKQKLITKNKVVIKNLKKNPYYFRVRAYRLEGTKKVYGAWSSVKKIKIKK